MVLSGKIIQLHQCRHLTFSTLYTSIQHKLYKSVQNSFKKRDESIRNKSWTWEAVFVNKEYLSHPRGVREAVANRQISIQKGSKPC